VEGVMAACELPQGDRGAFVAAREGVRYTLRMRRDDVVATTDRPVRWTLAS
jgi:hypothetical protein